jgi:hypothetical protein
MRVIEEVSRYDVHVNAVRMANQKHFASRCESDIRRLQNEGEPIQEPTRLSRPTRSVR